MHDIASSCAVDFALIVWRSRDRKYEMQEVGEVKRNLNHYSQSLKSIWDFLLRVKVLISDSQEFVAGTVPIP